MTSLFIGRWQPLHRGHITLINKVLDEGKRVLVAIRDTAIGPNNPYTVEERKKMFRKQFGDKITLIVIPDISEFCYGRKVGYKIRRIHLSKEIEAISATKIRSKNS